MNRMGDGAVCGMCEGWARGALLTEREAAAWLAEHGVTLSVRTLQRYRMSGEGPSFRRFGRRKVRYPAEALARWLRKPSKPPAAAA